MQTKSDIETLAKEFSSGLVSSLTPAALKKVIEANRQRKGTPLEDACASHDVCDPNMIMLTSFEIVFQRMPEFLCDAEKETADYELWNKSWKLASESEFFLK